MTDAPNPSMLSAKKRVRAHKPKVRTGCRTCRERHVKCDESKPACNRCIRMRLLCPGYKEASIPAARSTKFHSANPRPLAIRSSSYSSSISQGVISLTSQCEYAMHQNEPKPRRPSSPLYQEMLTHDLGFNSEIEQKYFLLFREQLSHEVSSWNNSTWSRLMLQASHNEPFVRYGIVAVSAQVKASKLAHAASLHPGFDDHVRNHHEFALKQYSKSVSLMIQTLSKPDHKCVRNVLLSSLLIFTFEGMIGRQELALQHGQSGVALLDSWLTQKACSPFTAAGMASPAPNLVEDDLVRAVGYLDTQIINLIDNRPSSVHEALMSRGTEALQNMPVSFRDLNEAQTFLEVILRRIGHFRRAALNSSPGYASFTRTSFRNIEDAKSTANAAATRPSLLQEQQIQCSIYMDEIVRWRAAADPLINITALDHSLPASVRANAINLKLYMLSTETLLKTIFEPQETSFDAYKSEFRETVRLTHQLITTLGMQRVERYSSVNGNIELEDENEAMTIGTTNTPMIVFGLAPTRALYIVCKRCRSPSIRRAAISIMRTFLCQDPSLSPEHSVAVAEAVMLLEEAGAVAIAQGDPLPTEVPLVPAKIPYIVKDKIIIDGSDNILDISVEEWLSRSEGPEMHIPEEARVIIDRLRVDKELRTTTLECLRALSREPVILHMPWK